MKLAIVTDAWLPQVNGVVTTLRRTARCLEALGHAVTVFSPLEHCTIPCPTYPEIRLALWPQRRLAAGLDALEPDAIHVATEGPLGMAAVHYCTARGLAFTTSYHTRFPQYVRKRLPIPEQWTYALLRRHHGRAQRTLVPTEQQRRDLAAHDFANVVLWSRGVDTELFRPVGRAHLELPGPVFAYAGRVAIEKNLDAFLALDLPGTKVVIGDGPDRALLARRYPDARFLGYRFGARACALPVVGGCVRVSEPHRHFRPRDARSHGVRHAGRGVSRCGSYRRRRARRHRNSRRRPRRSRAGAR